MTIESDRLVVGQSIGYLGTENYADISEGKIDSNLFSIFPSILQKGENLKVRHQSDGYVFFKIEIFGLNGVKFQQFETHENEISIKTNTFNKGVYFIRISGKNIPMQTQKIIIQ